MKLSLTSVGMCVSGVLALGVVGGMQACVSTAPPPARVDPAGGGYPQITVEPQLQQWIGVDRPIVTMGEVMKVMVPVRMDSNRSPEIAIQYQFTFVDSRGVPLPVQSGWQMATLPSRMRRELMGTALDRNAVDWRLEIRSGR